MKILKFGVEHVQKGERYMDDKGWSFRKSFERLGVIPENYFYKKKGKLSFLEKNKNLKDIWRSIMNRNLVNYV